MLETTLFALLFLQSFQNVQCKKVLISGYSDQITRINISETKHGYKMTSLGNMKVDPDMTWMQVVDDKLYAAHEVESYNGSFGAVVSQWNIEEDGLKKAQTFKIPTISPAHLLVDTEHDMLFTANYFGMSFTAIRLISGILEDILYHDLFNKIQLIFG